MAQSTLKTEMRGMNGCRGTKLKLIPGNESVIAKKEKKRVVKGAKIEITTFEQVSESRCYIHTN